MSTRSCAPRNRPAVDVGLACFFVLSYHNVNAARAESAGSLSHEEYYLERLPVTAVDHALRTGVKKVIHFKD